MIRVVIIAFGLLMSPGAAAAIQITDGIFTALGLAGGPGPVQLTGEHELSIGPVSVAGFRVFGSDRGPGDVIHISIASDSNEGLHFVSYNGTVYPYSFTQPTAFVSLFISGAVTAPSPFVPGLTTVTGLFTLTGLLNLQDATGGPLSGEGVGSVLLVGVGVGDGRYDPLSVIVHFGDVPDTAVPEPSTLMLVVLGSGAGIYLRRRRGRRDHERP